MEKYYRSRRRESQDIRFVRKAGQIMLQWEQQRMQKIGGRLFLLTADALERLAFIRRCVQEAEFPPISFRVEFDPLYNQLNITLEEYLFSDGSYSLLAILGAADSYSLDALTDGRMMLSIGIHDAAYEMEE